MGELLEYYVILATVEYTDDPLKMGRVKCHIPGIMHTYLTDKSALPWIRPFSMNAYQSFSKPQEGQKIWVLASKYNINEFWWFPYFETSNLTQDFLDNYYDNNPEVFHARDISGSMFTYDDIQGYKMKVGTSYLNVQPNGFDINSEGCHLKISGGKITFGTGSTGKGTYKVVNADKLQQYFDNLNNLFLNLVDASNLDTHTQCLKTPIQNIADALKFNVDDISFENISGN